MTYLDAGVLASIGLVIGVISGMLGIGGGLLVIPALMFIMGYDQKHAIGTSLAMLLPPIGIFAFITYYRAGFVNLPAGAMLAGLFAIGAWLGAVVVTKGWISDSMLRILFALLLLYVAGNLLFRSEPRMRAAFETLGLMGLYGIVYAIVRVFRKRWDTKVDAQEMYERKVERAEGPDYEI